jgi:hypothetical protein
VAKPAPKLVEVSVEPAGTVECPAVEAVQVERVVERCHECNIFEVWTEIKKLCYNCWQESIGRVYDEEQKRFVKGKK